MALIRKRKHFEYKGSTYFVNGLSYLCEVSNTEWQTTKQIDYELKQVYKQHERNKNK